ncbi:MAG: ChaN family lipoprotein [Desulfobacterales bacterium]
MIKDTSTAVKAGTIISGSSGKAVSFDEMMADLDSYQMIFVGEKHAIQSQHTNELEIIKAVFKHNPSMVVGMEMFDRSYQPVLDLWSAGVLDEETFLRKVQWYANWRYNFALYKDILLFIKDNKIKIVALNIPSYIASRIRVGGIDNLSDDDKRYLPKEIDTQNTAYRDYVKKAFKEHHFKGHTRFEDFYMAQCVWDEVMAESVAANLGNKQIVVLAGNGHIQYKYGIPDRAFRRTGIPFRTVCQASVGDEIILSMADYIWVTPAN